MAEFFNSKLGLPYVAEGAKLEAESVFAAVEPGRAPAATSTGATMGIDVASGGLNIVEIAEWREDQKIVLEARRARWDELDDLMLDYSIRMCVVDALPEKSDAMEFALRWPGRVYLAYYVENLAEFYRLDDNTRTLKGDRTVALDRALGRFRTGRVRLPKGLKSLETYAGHLVAPVRVYKETAKGVPIARYVNEGPDHYAHAAAYNEFAGAISPGGGLAVDVWYEPAPGVF